MLHVRTQRWRTCSKIACVFIEVNEGLLADELVTWTISNISVIVNVFVIRRRMCVFKIYCMEKEQVMFQ
jgi:hypothetical protein